MRAKALAQDQLGVGDVERGMELRAARVLHAVIGPERLRAVGRVDGLIRLRAGVSAGKRDVRGRVPVLRQQNVREDPRQRVDEGNDLVAARDPQRAAGAEVVLQVDDEQRVGGLNGMHLSFRC